MRQKKRLLESGSIIAFVLIMGIMILHFQKSPSDVLVNKDEEKQLNTQEIIKEANEQTTNEQTTNEDNFTLDQAVSYSICEMDSALFGKVTFGLRFDSKDSMIIGLFKNNELVYKAGIQFDVIEGDRYQGARLYPKLKEISFVDINQDGFDDITVIVEKYTHHTESLTFCYQLDLEANAYVFPKDFNTFLNEKRPAYSNDVVALARCFYAKKDIKQKDLLSVEEITYMSFEDRVQAFENNKLAAKLSIPNATSNDVKTVNDFINEYYYQYVYDDLTEQPEVTLKTLKGHDEDYLVLFISHPGSLYNTSYLLKNTDHQLEIIAAYEEYFRNWIDIYDGIIVENTYHYQSSNSIFASYIDTNDEIHELFHYESEWLPTYTNYYTNYFSDDYKEIMEQTDFSEEFLDSLEVCVLLVDGKTYYQFRFLEFADPVDYSNEYSLLIETFKNSIHDEDIIYCDRTTNIFQYAQEYAKTLGLTIREHNTY